MLKTATKLAFAQQLRLMDAHKDGKTREEFYSDPIEIQTSITINDLLVLNRNMDWTIK